jgi:hypothetical protein
MEETPYAVLLIIYQHYILAIRGQCNATVAPACNALTPLVRFASRFQVTPSLRYQCVITSLQLLENKVMPQKGLVQAHFRKRWCNLLLRDNSLCLSDL